MRMLRALVIALALVCLATPAFAAGELGLSWDGRTWATQLNGTLFNRPGIQRWVPGDSDTEHFYVRDQGGDAARLTIEYDLPPNSLVDPDDFDVTASVDGGAPVTLAQTATWVPLGGTTLPDGGVSDVAVTATFRSTSTNPSMDRSFSLAFRVTLTEAEASPGSDVGPGATAGPASGSGHGGGAHGSPSGQHNGSGGSAAPGADHGGLLPGTGAPAVRWAVTLGLLSLGGGIAIVARSRRRENDAS